MHELSIAENIVEIIHQYVPSTDRKRVRAVFTSVGEQSGVVADSLDFSFQAIIASTELERSHLEIETVPFIVRCSVCNAENRMEMGSRQCPNCGSLMTAVLSGMELTVREIELEDETEEVQ
jgi:hydrogenase nickel incorporation protein HypA/HybF